jgi:hypothetical protein
MDTIEFIFTQASLKLATRLCNFTGETLLLDYIRPDIKVYLLNVVLTELKTIVFNLQYYSHSNPAFKYKLDRLLQLVIFKVHLQLQRSSLFNSDVKSFSKPEIHWLVTNIEQEYNYLLILLFEHFSSFNQTRPFTDSDTFPILLLVGVLENIVIQLSEIVIYFLFMDSSLIKNIIDPKGFSDIFSITSQRNNVYWRSYFKETFLKPKYIYLNVYKVKIVTSEGICNKLLYLPNARSTDKRYLSKLQFLVLFYIELIEFLYPKGKTVLHFFRNMFK